MHRSFKVFLLPRRVGPGLLRSLIRGFAQDGPRSSSQQQRKQPQTGNRNSSNGE